MSSFSCHTVFKVPFRTFHWISAVLLCRVSAVFDTVSGVVLEQWKRPGGEAFSSLEEYGWSDSSEARTQRAELWCRWAAHGFFRGRKKTREKQWSLLGPQILQHGYVKGWETSWNQRGVIGVKENAKTQSYGPQLSKLWLGTDTSCRCRQSSHPDVKRINDIWLTSRQIGASCQSKAGH